MKATSEELGSWLSNLTEEEMALQEELLGWQNELINCVYTKDQMILSKDKIGEEIAEAQIVYSVSQAARIRERLSDILILKNVYGRDAEAN
jgi:hypothetical protein